MHGISTAYICAENKLYSSFCRCYFYSNHINSKIFKSKNDIDDTAFMLGIGHRDKNKCYFYNHLIHTDILRPDEQTAFMLGIGYRDVDKPYFQSLVGKPEYDEIVEWK